MISQAPDLQRMVQEFIADQWRKEWSPEKFEKSTPIFGPFPVDWELEKTSQLYNESIRYHSRMISSWNIRIDS